MKKVLIVDDFPSIRRVVRATLERAGFAVDEAENGVVAMAQLQGGSAYDLVISDYNMPEMNGSVLLETLRKHPQFRDMPVLFLTTEEEKDKRHTIPNAGNYAWHQKPFKLADFLMSVRCLVG